MSTLDLWPTLFGLLPELAEAAFLHQCRGQDVLASAFEPRPIFGMAAGEDVWLVALTTPRWKAIRTQKGATQLFDRTADPHELHDVAASEPAVVAELGKWLDREIARQRSSEALHHTTPPAEGGFDPTIIEQLRQLGYGNEGDDRGDGEAGDGAATVPQNKRD